jgi:CTD small phosphatase-like protein 2
VEDIQSEDPDVVLTITFPTLETVEAGINVRPHALDCLKKANECFQIGVFTASHKSYADAVLDYLDPNNELFSFRLYREHCIRTRDGIYMKDLRIIQNRNLKDVVLVDNAVYSFGF